MFLHKSANDVICYKLHVARYMIAGIILAGGDGKRFNLKDINKVAVPFLGKPMIRYGVEVLEGLISPIVIVVGSYADSVKNALADKDVLYAYQKQRLGTAHAAKVGFDLLKTFPQFQTNDRKLVIVGYGDHMMFYKKETVKKLINLHNKNLAMSIVTIEHDNPNKLVWGRIIRDSSGLIVDSVEQKDATPDQRLIKELNAGLYCFNYDFFVNNINKVEKSPITGEYYINSLIKIASGQGMKVAALKVPFDEVGIGVNRNEELINSQGLYSKVNK